jgi:hypothetical protein
MMLIDAIKMQDGSKTLEVLNDPHKKYRTLYFENNVDVRLCTKNGNTTLRSVWSQLYHGMTVADHELNMVACMTEIMSAVDFQ